MWSSPRNNDIQIKVAEIQRARAQLADTTREKVAIARKKLFSKP
ncbi:hypothetical protein [Anabaena catenula]|nr:hypothetical protein [Anabaena catenula]